MIVRMVEMTVPVAAAGRLHALLRRELPTIRESPGLVYAKLVRRVVADLEQVTLIEEWEDAASLYRWAGPDIDLARLPAGAGELLSQVRITHHEALDLDPGVVWPEYLDPPAAEAKAS